ncbi:hypothetical protein U9M48_006317 [Paspalum notatum var. saurae]|uniref:Protein TIFY n=1 Tax=Paspalum notatum var. saurae TaxID=547442 RepID=A0AAQ3PU38_PASNO
MAADEQHQQPASAAKAAATGRFAVTCGLLRQYMREQGGRCLAPAVAMGLMPAGGTDAAAAADLQAAAAPEAETTAVLELFPQQAGTLKDEQQIRKRKEPAAERAPLTIFYGGKMVVFDDFPAEKADEIMQLVAGSGTGNTTAAQQNNALGQPTAGLTDMPLARKVSLRRFLEKRKNRLTAADPYPASTAASESTTSTKPAVKQEAAPWLGVNSALSLS